LSYHAPTYDSNHPAIIPHVVAAHAVTSIAVNGCNLYIPTGQTYRASRLAIRSGDSAARIDGTADREGAGGVQRHDSSSRVCGSSRRNGVEADRAASRHCLVEAGR